MDGQERELFARGLRHATHAHSGAALDGALDELGWQEALWDDPRTAVSLFFELQGTAHTHASGLDAVVGSALGLEAHSPAGVVLPMLGRWHPPGEVVHGHLVVRGLGAGSLADRATAIVVASFDDDDLAVEMEITDLTLRPVHGVDPCLGLVEVAAEGVPLGAQRLLGPSQWPAAVALARLAAGHELVGVAKGMLELARTHALERIQFGQSISTFQAVRHRLAETLVAIEAADAALGSAWDERSPQPAALAKALAGRSARTAARHCQQVLAGIGFTTEHDFHLYVRRALVLDQLFGASRNLTRELGNELLATRQLPDLPPL